MNGEVVKLKYPATVAKSYRYRGAVENHNFLSYYGRTNTQIGLEIPYGKSWWSIQIFAFFVACTKLNVYLSGGGCLDKGG